LLCIKHLRDNIVDYMRNKCGVQQSVRNQLVAKMFDHGGLINADDSVAFTQAAETLAMKCESVSATLVQHFRRYVEPALHTFIFEPCQAASMGPSVVEQQCCQVRQPPAKAVDRVASTASARTR